MEMYGLDTWSGEISKPKVDCKLAPSFTTIDTSIQRTITIEKNDIRIDSSL